MYLLKTKGTSIIPDYIQIRDSEFVLTSHVKSNNIKEIAKIINEKEIEKVKDIISKLEYGTLQKI